MYEIILWAALFIIFVVAESLTAQLISIWFASGSLLALIVSLFSNNLFFQLLAFIGASLALLLFTRPILKKFIHTKHESTNADAFIGKDGILTQDVNNLQNTGRVLIDGLSWNARSDTGVNITTNTKVSVIRIQGVTAFVTPLE